MSDDTLGVLFTILLAALGGLAAIAYQDIRKRLGKVEMKERLHLTVLYHLATGTAIPDELKKELERAMVNGKGRA